MLDIQSLFVMDVSLQAYLILMVIDFITGFLKAWKEEGFKSRKIRDGVIRVIGELMGIVACGVLDPLLNFNGMGLLAIKSLLIFKEFVSISENLETIGVELPAFIVTHLEQYRAKNNEIKKEGK